VIAVARCGVYPQKDLNGVSPQRRRRYFQRGVGQRQGQYRINPGLAAHVEFGIENLAAAKRSESYDVIMCRNVLIYFPNDVADRVVAMFVDRVAVGGLLFLGHSEGRTQIPPRLEQVAPTAYRRLR
jgi:chemotaxis protein methyltransferase CheR